MKKEYLIFCCYRRKDEPDFVIRVKYGLEKNDFLSGRIFLDQPDIRYSENIGAAIEREMKSCKILLLFVGHKWLGVEEPYNLSEKDWVVKEIRYALEHGLVVFPLLLKGASFPDKEKLPDDIQFITDRKAFKIESDEHFEVIVRKLGSELQKQIQEQRGEIEPSLSSSVVSDPRVNADEKPIDWRIFIAVLESTEKADTLTLSWFMENVVPLVPDNKQISLLSGKLQDRIEGLKKIEQKEYSSLRWPSPTAAFNALYNLFNRSEPHFFRHRGAIHDALDNHGLLNESGSLVQCVAPDEYFIDQHGKITAAEETPSYGKSGLPRDPLHPHDIRLIAEPSTVSIQILVSMAKPLVIRQKLRYPRLWLQGSQCSSPLRGRLDLIGMVSGYGFGWSQNEQEHWSSFTAWATALDQNTIPTPSVVVVWSETMTTGRQPKLFIHKDKLTPHEFREKVSQANPQLLVFVSSYDPPMELQEALANANLRIPTVVLVRSGHAATFFRLFKEAHSDTRTKTPVYHACFTMATESNAIKPPPICFGDKPHDGLESTI